MDEIDEFVVLEEVEALAEGLRRRQSRGRNGETLTTFPSSPLSRCHSSEKEGRVPSKYEPTSETPLRHAPRRDMFPSPDKEFIINRRRRRK